jgi:outer membrane protein
MNSKISVFILLFLTTLTSFSQVKNWTLQECVEYAMKNNISIRQTELDLKTVAIDKKVALGNFLPTLNGSVAHSWNIGLNQNITTGLLENQTTQFTSAGINSSVDIYNGLQNLNRYRRANISKIASQYQLDKMKDDVSLNIANAYLQILFNKESIKVQKEQLLNTQKQEIRTTEMVNAGMIPRGDLLDIKATVAADKQRLIAAENALFLSKLSLAQLMQLDDFKDFDVVEENVTLQESVVMLQTPEAIVEKAKQDRVELKITKTNLELAQKDIQIAKGAFLPSLSGFYSFDTRASDSPGFAGFDNNGNPIIATLPLFDQFSNNKGHVFGVRLSVPIFNGFAVKTNVDRTKIAFERSKIAQEQAEVDLERNVYNAVTDAKGALNSYQSAVVALTAREEAFNYAKERFAVGMMNSFDFNQAQTLFLNAQSEVLRTKYDYIFKQKVVEFYFGIPIKQKI